MNPRRFIRQNPARSSARRIPVVPRRGVRRGTLVLLVVAATWPVACTSSQDPAPTASGWEHSRTTEGDVTTVTTTAGSKWGGPAILEEELSIGVAAGEEPYMLGQVVSVWATDDAIWVVDRGVPAVRMYDHQGNWLRDVGSAGQGPGEYETPGEVLVTGDGRIVVADMMRRTNIYDAGGAPLATWSDSGRGAVFVSGGSMLLRSDGSLWKRTSAMPSEQEMQRGGTLRVRQGMAPLGEDGATGELIEPPEVDGQGAGMQMQALTRYGGGGGTVSMSGGPSAPFMPSYVWTMAPNGDWVVGDGDDYRFEIHHAGGGKTIVQRYWDPVAVLEEEATYFVGRIEGQRQRLDPEYRYDGPPVPATKPAYAQISVDRGGRIWVRRQGTGYRVPGCEDGDSTQTFSSGGGRMVMSTAQPCWSSAVIRDVFDANGDYLGEVIAPEGLDLGASYIEDDLFLVVAEDEEGLVMVKKYRIVPGGSLPS